MWKDSIGRVGGRKSGWMRPFASLEQLFSRLNSVGTVENLMKERRETIHFLIGGDDDNDDGNYDDVLFIFDRQSVGWSEVVADSMRTWWMICNCRNQHFF